MPAGKICLPLSARAGTRTTFAVFTLILRPTIPFVKRLQLCLGRDTFKGSFESSSVGHYERFTLVGVDFPGPWSWRWFLVAVLAIVCASTDRRCVPSSPRAASAAAGFCSSDGPKPVGMSPWRVTAALRLHCCVPKENKPCVGIRDRHYTTWSKLRPSLGTSAEDNSLL